ncbi:MAG TPA: replication-associated recombination protein A [Candidatus Moranbacteria bacterium]|nr:replication-associated recombination protein A [Candidatus Moranbacteria bacterium]
MNTSPLADRIRPQTLNEFFGQKKLISKNSYLQNAIENDRVPSMIFWGPPGSGKTTLAQIIANLTKSDFIKLSAVSSGKKQLVEIVEKAKENIKIKKKTILFIDEIHRWNKAQQDALLPYVENGTIILIGATTENPSFEVIGALISRARVFVLEKLEKEDIEKILKRAISIVGNAHVRSEKKIKISEDTIRLISNLSNGDARMALNTLEALINANKNITEKLVKEILQKTHLLYDKTGEEHYNIISALHKSMRGGDANAALYWLARMIEGGEDPLYIARRLVRFASEDIGLANNTALILANAVFDACHKLGYPECNVHLAQCVIYLSKSKKDVTAYLAYEKAKKDVTDFGNLPIPFHIRNAPTKLMKELGYGKNYKYTPLEDSSDQTYLPNKLKNKKYI